MISFWTIFGTCRWPHIRQYFHKIFFQALIFSSYLWASHVTCRQVKLECMFPLGCALIMIPFHVLKDRFVWTFPHLLIALNPIQMKIGIASFLWFT